MSVSKEAPEPRQPKTYYPNVSISIWLLNSELLARDFPLLLGFEKYICGLRFACKTVSLDLMICFLSPISGEKGHSCTLWMTERLHSSCTWGRTILFLPRECVCPRLPASSLADDDDGTVRMPQFRDINIHSSHCCVLSLPASPGLRAPS